MGAGALPWDVAGYVVCSGEHTWQQDSNNSLTETKARSYLRALRGIFPKGDMETILKITHRYWFVTTEENDPNQPNVPMGTCQCPENHNRAECKHLYCVGHIEGSVDLQAHIESLNHPRQPGRKKKYVPVGFAAHKPDPDILKRAKVDYVGASVALRIPERNKDLVWCGKVTGTLLVCKIKLIVMCLI